MGCRERDTPIFSLHSVNLQFFSPFGKFCGAFLPFGNFCNSSIPSGSFFDLTFSVGVEKSRLASSYLLSDWLLSSTRASKSSILEMQ